MPSEDLGLPPGVRERIRAEENSTPTARAVEDQVQLIETLSRPGRSADQLAEAIHLSSQWTDRERAPSGATFVNLSVLARLRQLEREGALSPKNVRQLTSRLARASLDDPGNLDLLHNLSVLFGFLGDSDRSQLAHTLYQRQSARSGH